MSVTDQTTGNGTHIAKRLAEVNQEIQVSPASGGIQIANVAQAMAFAQSMSSSDFAVPKHLRGNVGACFAVVTQSIEWRMSPFSVANKSYVVNDRIAYESQLIHAVIEQRAPLVGRLRHDFSGDGDNRRCRVWATVRGEEEPLEYESPPIGKITVKNSPLWKSKPDLQLFYNASRDWARMYFPDVLMGVYSDDELDRGPVESPGERVKGPAGLVAKIRNRRQVASNQSDPSNEVEHGQRDAEVPVLDRTPPDDDRESQPSSDLSPLEAFKIGLSELAVEQMGSTIEKFEEQYSKWLARAARGADGFPTTKEREAITKALQDKAGPWAYLA